MHKVQRSTCKQCQVKQAALLVTKGPASGDAAGASAAAASGAAVGGVAGLAGGQPEVGTTAFAPGKVLAARPPAVPILIPSGTVPVSGGSSKGGEDKKGGSDVGGAVSPPPPPPPPRKKGKEADAEEDGAEF